MSVSLQVDVGRVASGLSLWRCGVFFLTFTGFLHNPNEIIYPLIASAF